MPLIKREVEPVFVSQVDIGKDVKEELECVTNYTLASIIRQLSNLGKHAEDIFGDLLQEATSLANRAKSVQDRMDKISDTISKLDPLTDAVSLRDINTRMAFRSSLVLDVEVVSSPTMPSAMKETYMRCQQPPALSKLNHFRQDQKDGLKFYTDPKFFFERWKKEQHEDIETKTKKKKRKRRPHSSNVSKPKKVLTTKEKYKDHALGQEFVEMERARKAKEKNSSDTTSPTKEHESRAEDRSEKRDSQEASPQHTPKRATPDSVRKPGKAPPPAPPPPMPVSNGGVVDDSSAMSLPPPPPMDDDSTYSEVGEMPPPPPTLTGNIAPPPPASPNAPPVPPPPPVPSSAGPAPPPPPPLPAAGGPPLPPATPTPRQTSVSSNPRPPTAVSQVTGSRDDLLSAIKQGMQLRRVDIKVKDRRNEPENNSVEAILRRRIAVELSSEGETESESGDSDWDDDED